MSQQQPGWQPPQQQPGWGTPQQPWGAPPPQPPKKSPVGKILGFGCLGVVALFLAIGVIGAALSGSDSDNSTTSKPAASTPQEPQAKAPADDAKPSENPKTEEAKKEEKPKVTFKIWGTAPNGVDINYGSDTDSRQGTFKNGEFTATLPVDEDALYFTVMGQLQGGGDIQCSVTIGGETKKAHASGDYNICHAQLNAGLLGGWD